MAMLPNLLLLEGLVPWKTTRRRLFLFQLPGQVSSQAIMRSNDSNVLSCRLAGDGRSYSVPTSYVFEVGGAAGALIGQ